jgi:hypothetical protein
MLHKDQYASLEPLPAEALLEKVSEYQEEADRLETDAAQLKAEAKEKSQEAERWHGKIALIARARRAGRPVRVLLGGELSDEEPRPDDTPDLPFPPEERVPLTPVAVHEDNGARYEATSSDGKPCVVVEDSPGKWWGRWDGRPCGMDLPTSEMARQEVEKIVGESLDWTVMLPKPGLVESVDV